MSDVTGVTGTNPYAPPKTAKQPVKELDKDAFLKLFVAQMQNQNPMSPQDNNQFIAQMAQFSTVELLGNLEKAVEKLATIQQVQQSAALIDRRVTVQEAEGAQITGKVEKVHLSGNEVMVTVDGKDYGVNQIVEIQGGSLVDQNQPAQPVNTTAPTAAETQNTGQ